MEQQTVDNVKIMTFQEKIRIALQKGDFDQQESILKMEALDLGVSQDDFKKMVEIEKKSVTEVEAITRTAKSHKGIIWGIAILLILLEWLLIFNAHPAEGEKSHLLLALIVNFITLVVYIIGVAAYIRKKK